MANPSDMEARLAMNQVLEHLKLAKTQPDSEDEEYSSNRPAPQVANGQVAAESDASSEASSDTSGNEGSSSKLPPPPPPLPPASTGSSSTASSGAPSPQVITRRPANTKPVDTTPQPQARNTMNNCIDTIRKSGRSTLNANEDPLAAMQFTSDKPRELENILKVLGIQQERVAHDKHSKYVLLREGVTSYVYLAKCQSVQ